MSSGVGLADALLWFDKDPTLVRQRSSGGPMVVLLWLGEGLVVFRWWFGGDPTVGECETQPEKMIYSFKKGKTFYEKIK